MKKIVLVCIACVFLARIGSSQDEGIQTLFGNKELKISGFGGPFMTFTNFDGEFAHMMGGGGGIIVNDFFFGGFGLGMTTNIPYVNDERYNVEFGYGGLWFGYNFLANRVVHPVFHVQLGWGSIGKSNINDYGPSSDQDAIFVLSPTIELEANITHFFKIGVGGNYRLVTLVDGDYSQKDLSDYGVMLSFKFGWFE